MAIHPSLLMNAMAETSRERSVELRLFVTLGHVVQVPGGKKMQTICLLPLPQPRMHACMRLSFDSRRGRFRGTIAVPCFVLTESCGKLPVWAFCAKAQLSTGARPSHGNILPDTSRARCQTRHARGE